jgi:hypothetical protein
VSTTLSAATGGPNGEDRVPDDDEVHECSREGCEAWRYSWLALQFHQLREHIRGGEE